MSAQPYSRADRNRIRNYRWPRTRRGRELEAPRSGEGPCFTGSWARCVLGRDGVWHDVMHRRGHDVEIMYGGGLTRPAIDMRNARRRDARLAAIGMNTSYWRDVATRDPAFAPLVESSRMRALSYSGVFGEKPWTGGLDFETLGLRPGREVRVTADVTDPSG